MQILSLPNELLFKIFEYGGVDALMGPPAQTCRRMREISNDPALWLNLLAPHFVTQNLTESQIQQISDFRKWNFAQRAATRRTLENLDLLANEMDASPEDIEAYAWQILKLRMRAIEGLDSTQDAPRTIAHLHWSFWLKEILYRLEGIQLLLDLSTNDNWGNGIVERPIEQIIALYALRNGRFPMSLFNAVHFQQWDPKHARSGLPANKIEISPAKFARKFSTKNRGDSRELPNLDRNKTSSRAAAADLAQIVISIFARVSSRNDFLAVLGRGALFIELACQIEEQMQWNCRLLKLPFGSYVCVQFSNDDTFFVDFQREGKLRMLEEIKDRINQVRSSGSVHYGVSLYDTLATSYVWHTAPTSTRHCVLDLIEHAANDVKVTQLSRAPRLYTNLVRRIINRNVTEVENAPISRTVSSASLAGMVGSVPGGWPRKGNVVRILAGDHTDAAVLPSEDSHSNLGVVIQVSDGSVLVLKGSEMVRVIKKMLQPVSHLSLTFVRGLYVPDIGVDLCMVGQHFKAFNALKERFE